MSAKGTNQAVSLYKIDILACCDTRLHIVSVDIFIRMECTFSWEIFCATLTFFFFCMSLNPMRQTCIPHPYIFYKFVSVNHTSLNRLCSDLDLDCIIVYIDMLYSTVTLKTFFFHVPHFPPSRNIAMHRCIYLIGTLHLHLLHLPIPLPPPSSTHLEFVGPQHHRYQE